VLRVRSGPRSIREYRDSSEKWAPLLQQLGGDPPFRLQTLELDGLVSSQSAPTLDHIIETHSPTLRRLVLEHTNFHYPNTLRAFFYALSRSNVNYYKTNWLYIHQRTYLLPSTLCFIVVPDEVLTHSQVVATDDESCLDWVRVIWDVNGYDVPLIYDNEDDWYGENWMKNCFMNALAAINCGAVKDF
jgi:hypothetical protein